jgi:tetratricopeptide (TPR) repeat protein
MGRPRAGNVGEGNSVAVSKNTSKALPAWVPALALFLVTAALYSPALRFDFVGYDDDDYVTENPYVQRGLTGEMAAWAFTTGYGSNWFPLTWISHAADWQFAGPKPGLHHATNIILHAMNSVLLFMLLKRATQAVWPSFVVGALFAVHPFNVESVAWIAERKNVLSMFFGLCSLIAFSEYTRRPKRSLYIASCLLLACGLMSKPMLVTWPFVMLLFDYWPLGRIKSPLRPLRPFLMDARKLVVEKVPFFLLATASSVTTYVVQAQGGAMGSVESIPPLYRIGNALVSYCNYVIMTIWPFGLAALYPHPFEALPLWKALAAAIALTATTWGVIAYAGKARYLVTGWFIFLGTLVPVIGVVQVGSQAMADRYAYVPIIGLFIVVVWGFAEIRSRAKFSRNPERAVGCIVIALLMLRTWDQLPHWRNGIALWQHTIAVTHDNYIAHNNLGSALRLAKQPDRALAEFKESLRIRPSHPGALVNVGLVLLDQGKPTDAAKAFEKAIAANPRHGPANLNLAVAYFQMRDPHKALGQAQLALQVLPDDPKVYNLLGILSDILGRPDEAVNYLRKALEINPNYANAKSNLDRVLSRQGPAK